MSMTLMEINFLTIIYIGDSKTVCFNFSSVQINR